MDSTNRQTGDRGGVITTFSRVACRRAHSGIQLTHLQPRAPEMMGRRNRRRVVIQFCRGFATGFVAGLGLFATLNGLTMLLLGADRYVAIGTSMFIWITMPFVTGSYMAKREIKSQLQEERARAGLCIQCGYDLRASKERCPECGAYFRAKPPRLSKIIGDPEVPKNEAEDNIDE